jgi:hypothetical protein
MKEKDEGNTSKNLRFLFAMYMEIMTIISALLTIKSQITRSNARDLDSHGWCCAQYFKILFSRQCITVLLLRTMDYDQVL